MRRKLNSRLPAGLATGLAMGVALLLALPAGAAEAERAGVVGVRKIIYGDAFTDIRGMTLYARTATEACTASCLLEWRPLPAAALAKPIGAWTIVTHPEDGRRQWALQGKPVYTYAGDVAPGDVNGEGLPGWETAMAKRNHLPPDIALRPTDYGQTLTTRDGRTLYLKISYVNSTSDLVSRHFGKPAGPETCVDECLKSFTPLKAPEGAQEQDHWKVIVRPDGSRQWSWRGFPLYTFAGDAKPGDILGEGHWDVDEKTRAMFWEVANLIP